MKPPAIVILGEKSLVVARKIQIALPEAVIYGLGSRTQSADLTYENFGDLVRELFANGTPIIGICATGILIRTVAPLLKNKWQEPPLLAIAEDGSAVVPLLGGITGVNDLARQISATLQVSPAITTTGEIRFKTTLLSPPPGYRLINPDDAKGFIADLLAGQTVKLIGSANWLTDSELSFSPEGALTIAITDKDQINITPSPTCLVYEVEQDQNRPLAKGKLTIVGIGPGSEEWLSPQVLQILRSATDWVGYKTYLDLVEYLRKPNILRHESDNRVELERAEMALNLAAEGKSVVVVSSGDPGIYGMAAAVFEVLERKPQAQWDNLTIKVCPGISAMQAAASLVGAPLGHDFCVISLSNILKPWEVIATRINLAAQADLVIAFYNPVSKERTWQLSQAKEILLQWRKPETPIVLARNVGRPGQEVRIKSLIDLAIADADMRTLILIGSSQTRLVQQGDRVQWLYTPRHYG
jgi:cobalt-precorrin 5A hydrolase / precorrin-3B C17-methyltransferase